MTHRKAGHLVIEAKQPIIDTEFRKFLTLIRQEEWESAARQLGVMLACIADVLDESRVLLLDVSFLAAGVEWENISAAPSGPGALPRLMTAIASMPFCRLRHGGRPWAWSR